MEGSKDVASMLRRFADDVEHGRIDWVWIASKYTDGLSIKYATDKAPKRPGGF